MRMQGIYKIVNLADGKASSYIGSSVDIKKRWACHRSTLHSGKHDNARLQHAWNKYGEDAFAFSGLEEVEGDMLPIMEQEYLDDYFDRGHCYNLARFAEASPMLGRSHTEEARRKMRLAAQSRPPVSEETRSCLSESLAGSYPAFVHQETGEIIPAGMNLRALCRERGLARRCMWGVKTGKRPHHNGWVLAYD